MTHRIHLVGILFAFVLLAAAGCNEDEESSTSGTSSPASSSNRVEIRVDGQGYHPAEVQARTGQPVTLVFTRTTDETCGQELVVPSEDIRKNLPLDEAVEVTLTPAKAGRIAFTCGMNMLQGAVVVQ